MKRTRMPSFFLPVLSLLLLPSLQSLVAQIIPDCTLHHDLEDDEWIQTCNSQAHFKHQRASQDEGLYANELEGFKTPGAPQTHLHTVFNPDGSFRVPEPEPKLQHGVQARLHALIPVLLLGVSIRVEYYRPLSTIDIYAIRGHWLPVLLGSHTQSKSSIIVVLLGA